MWSFFAMIMLLLPVLSAVVLSDKCSGDAGLELMMVLDMTTGWGTEILDEVSAQLSTFADQLKSIDSTIRAGFATYTDKPNVGVGIGTYGGYPGPWIEDWCFNVEVALARIDVVSEHLVDCILSATRGSGQDIYEAQFEAIVTAAVDHCVGWTPTEVNEKVVKTILLVTDSFGHAGGFKPLSDSVNAFNSEVNCVNGIGEGGFGAEQASAGGDLASWTVDKELYNEYASLYSKIHCQNSMENLDRFEALANLLSPTKMPAVLPFNRTLLQEDPAQHCRFHEYPSYQEIVQILQEESIQLVVMLVELNPSSDMNSVWEWAITDAEGGLGKLNPKYIKLGKDNLPALPTELFNAISELFPCLSA